MPSFTAVSFPPIHDRSVAAPEWLQDYVATYVGRDVRQILRIQDLAVFQRFLALCAGRVGQLVNVTSLAADAGITRVTAEAWLSVLEASHLVFRVQPWFTNLSKRLIKTPKLHFLRDKEGHEIDAFIQSEPDTVHAIEIKSGSTVASDSFDGLDFWRQQLPGLKIRPWLIYGGDAPQFRERGTVLPWSNLTPLLEALPAAN